MEPPIQDTRSTPSVAASGPSINAASLSLPAHPRRSASKNTRPRARGREGAAIGETETERERGLSPIPPSPSHSNAQRRLDRADTGCSTKRRRAFFGHPSFLFRADDATRGPFSRLYQRRACRGGQVPGPF
jgi:hypothetical protein